MNKKIITIVIGVVLIAAAFYGGLKYGQSQSSGLNRGAGNFFNQTGAVGLTANGQRNGARTAGNFATGEILAKDDNSITIKLTNGGSKIALISNSTEVQKTASGSLSDLIVGEQVNVSGSTNADGSLTARSIQIRPAAPQSATAGQ